MSVDEVMFKFNLEGLATVLVLLLPDIYRGSNWIAGLICAVEFYINS